MWVLVTYDVSTIDKSGATRLRKVARACKDYGTRVQNSVFEVKVAKVDWVKFKHRLVSILDEKQDSLRFYFLDLSINVEHYGTKKPVDLEQPLIF